MAMFRNGKGRESEMCIRDRYNTRFVPAALVEAILNSPRVADVHKEQLQKMIVRKGELSFYDIFTLARAESTS